MRNKKNVSVRTALKKYGIFQYELAEMLGVSESTLVKKLRKELDCVDKNNMINAIKNLSTQKKSN